MDFFSKCDMKVKSELSFVKGGVLFKLPFLFHIKDININFIEEENGNVVKDYGKDIYFQNRLDEIEIDNKYYLKFIDLNQWTFSDVDGINSLFKKKKDNYIAKDIESAYTILVSYLNFNELDFAILKKFCLENQLKLVVLFREMVDSNLEVGSSKVEPNDVFMILRCAYELNHSATVFPENIGKSISEYSFREMCIQRSYMARKCEIEKLQYEESLKKSQVK